MSQLCTPILRASLTGNPSAVYQELQRLTLEHLFYIIKSTRGIPALAILPIGVQAVQRLRRFPPHPAPLDRGPDPAQPPGLRERLRRLFARTKGRPSYSVEVGPEIFAHLRRAARLRRRSPQALARDLLTRGLSQETLREHTEAVLSGLTPREAEVLWQAARGRTNRQIATALVVSPETVKTHVHNILLKLGLRSKADLRLLMLDLGIRWWQDE